jgi:hypothetical protein
MKFNIEERPEDLKVNVFKGLVEVADVCAQKINISQNIIGNGGKCELRASDKYDNRLKLRETIFGTEEYANCELDIMLNRKGGLYKTIYPYNTVSMLLLYKSVIQLSDRKNVSVDIDLKRQQSLRILVAGRDWLPKYSRKADTGFEIRYKDLAYYMEDKEREIFSYSFDELLLDYSEIKHLRLYFDAEDYVKCIYCDEILTEDRRKIKFCMFPKYLKEDGMYCEIGEYYVEGNFYENTSSKIKLDFNLLTKSRGEVFEVVINDQIRFYVYDNLDFSIEDLTTFNKVANFKIKR